MNTSLISRALQVGRMSAYAALMALTSGALALSAHAAPADPSQDTRQLDEELKKYWGSEVREVDSLQKRLYRKDSRQEFTLYGGVIPNDEFHSYYPLGLRASHFFAEDFGLELWGAYDFAVDSGLKGFLEGPAFNEALKVDIRETLEWMAGVNFVWSPIHGKLGIFAKPLGHFDLYLAMGAGVVATTAHQLDSEEERYSIAGNVGLGMRFFVTDQISVRFDYRQFFFAAASIQNAGGGLSHPAELTIGISFWTAAPE